MEDTGMVGIRNDRGGDTPWQCGEVPQALMMLQPGYQLSRSSITPNSNTRL